MVLRELHFKINNDYETPKDNCKYEYNYYFVLEGYCDDIHNGFIKVELGKGNDFSSALDYAYINVHNKLKYKHNIITHMLICTDYYVCDNIKEIKNGYAFYDVNNNVDFLIEILDDENAKTKKHVLEELFKISVLHENCELKKKGLEYLVDCNYHDALYELGCYYDKKKEYDLMIKYYEMAINKCNDVNAMHNLAFYYEMINQNNELAEKYYLMILDKDINKNKDASAMFKLGRHYQNNENNIIKAEKYYLMAIENCTEEDKKYYLQLIEELK